MRYSSESGSTGIHSSSILPKIITTNVTQPNATDNLSLLLVVKMKSVNIVLQIILVPSVL